MGGACLRPAWGRASSAPTPDRAEQARPPHTSPTKRSFTRSTGLPVDLPDGAEVISEMRDARDHPGELDGLGVARRTERRQPSSRFAAQAVADVLPGCRI